MQAIWIVVASLLFASMGVCIKFASANFSVPEIIFSQGVVGMVCMWLLARCEGTSLRTKHVQIHAWRSVVGSAGLADWFYAFTLLPLATAMALNYLSGTWVALSIVAGGMVLLKPSAGDETQRGKINIPVGLALVFALSAILLFLQPAMAEAQLFAGVVGLISGSLAALAYAQGVALSRLGEPPPARAVFYLSAGCAFVGSIWMLSTGLRFSSWTSESALWLLAIGIVTPLAQWCLTRGLSENRPMATNCQHTSLIFAAIFTIGIFSEKILMSDWIGMAAVVVSGVSASVGRIRSSQFGSRV